jgi:adenylate cyclase
MEPGVQDGTLMTSAPDTAKTSREEMFRQSMEGSEPDYVRLRRFFHWLPTDPRCKNCNAPFGLPGALVARAMGRRRWEKSPRFCNRCYTFLVDYGLTGVEITISVLFADVRDSTTLAERVGPAEFRRRINRFYRITGDALISTDGLVDKFIGDGAVGLYIPGLSGADHARKAVDAARRILARTAGPEPDRPDETSLPVGIGVHTGTAFVGAVGDKSEVQDFTALGDAVNATARMSSLAGAGEALISRAAAAAAGLDGSGLEERRLELKGRQEPMDVVVMRAP